MKNKAMIDRFWEKVKKSDNCWEWTASKNQDGYGNFTKATNRVVKAHRLSWEIHNGPIPKGMCVLHKCDNPPCVNPNHLFLGTKADNNVDMAAKGRHKSQIHPELILKGEECSWAKLSEANVLEIRKEYSKGTSVKFLAERFEVKPITIYMILQRKRWRHLL